MVIQSLLLRNSPPLLGEGRGGDPGPDPGDPGPDPGDPGPGPGDPGPDPGDPGPDPGDPGSEEEENFYASVLAAPSGKSSAKPWLSSASSRPLAAWHSSAKQRRG